MKKAQTLELLWKRTKERGEFPALKRAVSSIVSAISDDEISSAQLAATVLSDFSLTQKVLRLANSAMYAPYGQNVVTVSRALMILGSSTVAHIAIGIQLLETFDGLSEKHEEAAEELALAAFSGKLAREIATISGATFGEEAVVTTLIYQLPRLLVLFYLPDEWKRIQEQLEFGFSEDAAFLEVLGMTPDELNAAAIEEWSLPFQIVRKEDALPKVPGQVVRTHADWLACIAGAATEMTHALNKGADQEQVSDILRTYASALGIEAASVEEIARTMFEEEKFPVEMVDAEEESPTSSGGKPLDATVRLEEALSEVQLAAKEADVPTLTQLVLETMMHSLGLASCAAFFRSATKKRFEARFAFGQCVKNIDQMCFEEEFSPDVFHLAMSQKQPIFLSDVRDSKISSRIPGWHKAVFPDACSTFLMPIHVKGRSICMLYGNWGQNESITAVTPDELNYLLQMRDLIAGAIEQGWSSH
jgi:HD-like signal output (HDOD) protein